MSCFRKWKIDFYILIRILGSKPVTSRLSEFQKKRIFTIIREYIELV